MLIEKWIKWEPFGNAANKYSLISFVSDIGIEKIVLFDLQNRSLQVCFDFALAAVHLEQKSLLSSDSKKRLLLKKYYGDAFIEEWAFFKVINSLRIQSMNEQALGSVKFDNFIHFVFIVDSYLFEVVALRDPIITITNTVV